MTLFSVKLSTGDPITIDEREFKGVIEAIMRRDGIVICKRGAFNPAYFVSVSLLEERPDFTPDIKMVDGKPIVGKKPYEEPVSPFAKILAEKMHLPPQLRNAAQEEAAREKRKA